jgi:hypothetical protein
MAERRARIRARRLQGGPSGGLAPLGSVKPAEHRRQQPGRPRRLAVTALVLRNAAEHGVHVAAAARVGRLAARAAGHPGAHGCGHTTATASPADPRDACERRRAPHELRSASTDAEASRSRPTGGSTQPARARRAPPGGHSTLDVRLIRETRSESFWNARLLPRRQFDRCRRYLRFPIRACGGILERTAAAEAMKAPSDPFHQASHRELERHFVMLESTRRLARSLRASRQLPLRGSRTLAQCPPDASSTATVTQGVTAKHTAITR